MHEDTNPTARPTLANNEALNANDALYANGARNANDARNANETAPLTNNQ